MQGVEIEIVCRDMSSLSVEFGRVTLVGTPLYGVI